MKFLILFATLAAFASARPRVTDDSLVDCSDAAEGTLLPDPTDCSRFFTCSHGEAVPSQCDDPLVFDPVLGVCNWQGQVNCQVSTTTTEKATTTITEEANTTTTEEATTTTTEEATTTTEEEATTTTEEEITTTEEATTTTEEATTTTEEETTTTEKATTTTTEEEATTTEEEATTTEEEATTTTEEEATTTQEATTTTTTEKVTTAGLPIECPTGKYAKVADPASCNWYYICQRDGSIEHKKCPFQLYYNPKLYMCSIPSMVDCKN